jgi:predicted RNase H-like HicB family nuclease
MHRFTVELIPDPEQGGFTARVPDIPAYGEGETEDEAIADLREALLCFVESKPSPRSACANPSATATRKTARAQLPGDPVLQFGE